jgi:hypothetical protein
MWCEWIDTTTRVPETTRQSRISTRDASAASVGRLASETQLLRGYQKNAAGNSNNVRDD